VKTSPIFSSVPPMSAMHFLNADVGPSKSSTVCIRLLHNRLIVSLITMWLSARK
jgi:hypothetical protein